VFVEFIHYLWSTVYDGVGSVFGIFSDAVASKATHVVLVDRVGGLYGIDVFVVVERCEKRLEIANKIKEETLFCEIAKYIRRGS